MNNLPSPSECKNHVPVFMTEIVAASPSLISYDLDAMNRKFILSKETKLLKDKEGLLVFGFELVEDRLYQSIYNRTPEYGGLEQQEEHIFKDIHVNSVFGYSHRDNSLTMCIKDNTGVIKAIVIRHSCDKDGNQVKWKTYGSKKYVPYKLHKDEDFVFLYSGMAELILMKLLGFSYVGLQSDSMVKHLPQELKSITKDKVIVLLQDNDDSFKKIVPSLKTFFASSIRVVCINFEKLLSRRLPKGYDFRDFCNELGDIKIIKSILKEGIQNEF